MFDLNNVDDVFENNYLSNAMQPTASLLHLWYKRSRHGIRKLFLVSLPHPREYRTIVALLGIYVLIYWQTFVAKDSGSGLDMNYKPLNQARILELQAMEPGDLQVTIPKRVVLATLLQNGSYETGSDHRFSTFSENTTMQHARETASRACQEQPVQEQANMLVLVKALGKDASAYFSLRDDTLEKPVQGGFLFDCPELLVKVQLQKGTQPHADIIFISGQGGDRKDIIAWTVDRLSQSRSGTFSTLYSTAFPLIGAVILLWCSTRIFESKEKELLASSAKDVRPKIIKAKLKPVHAGKAEEKETSHIVSPAVQVTEIASKTDDEVVNLGLQNKLRLYSLETQLGDAARAVEVRRRIVTGKTHGKVATSKFDPSGLPFKDYNYGLVMGACCENVIGYLPVPVGVAGPLNIDGNQVFLPMATTEGALVASTNRGCTAINLSGGVTSLILSDGMTRGPCVRFPNLKRAAAAKIWLDSEEGFQTVKEAFNSTSRFGRLQSIKSAIAGSDLFIRFKARTGDAMGMNMISKGVERALAAIIDAGFDDMRVVSLSGNYCTDKKAAAINWVDGRGKSVAAQATISAETLRKVLKVDVDSMVELNTSKNLIGSCLAGSIGGFNAHAANIVSAIFLATGQDIAQNVESSSCLTTMRNVNGSLQISVSMPSIEVGTVGGGTVLEAQGTMLDLLGVRGADTETPGGNAQGLARIVAAAVLAGELSLCSALAAGSLVQSHMALNRK